MDYPDFRALCITLLSFRTIIYAPACNLELALKIKTKQMYSSIAHVLPGTGKTLIRGIEAT